MKSLDQNRRDRLKVACGLDPGLLPGDKPTQSRAPANQTSVLDLKGSGNLATTIHPYNSSPTMRVDDRRVTSVRERHDKTKRHVNQSRISRNQLSTQHGKGPDSPAGIVRRCFSDSSFSVKRARVIRTRAKSDSCRVERVQTKTGLQAGGVAPDGEELSMIQLRQSVPPDEALSLTTFEGNAN